MKTIILHIGIHKTGTTSFQLFLKKERAKLERLGFGVYTGAIEPENHIEIYVAAMREDRDSFAKDKYGISGTREFQEKTIRQVRSFVETSPCQTLIFSTEGLSLLRFEDEMARLVQMIDPSKCSVRVLLTLRDRNAYLQSFRQQIEKHAERSFSGDPDSVYYVKDDSWLGDFDRIIRLYGDTYGVRNLTVLDYDLEMRERGNILPAMLSACGLDPGKFGDLNQYRMNTYGRLAKFKTRLKRALLAIGVKR